MPGDGSSIRQMSTIPTLGAKFEESMTSIAYFALFALSLLTFPCAAQTWTEGGDGKRVFQPSGWTWTDGRDGRRVVYPSGWNWTEGRDGRRVVYPSGWTWTDGSDGRRVVYPSNWTWTDGRDGRRVVYPSNWTWTDGRNGRRIVYGPNEDIGMAFVRELRLPEDLRPYTFLLLEQMGVLVLQ